jgi:hypothetical protein
VLCSQGKIAHLAYGRRLWRDNIGLHRLPFSVRWSGDTLQASCLQDFGSQDLEAKATRVPLCGFDQPVYRFRVGVGNGMIEKGEDWVKPVGNSREQGLKGGFHLRWNGLFGISCRKARQYTHSKTRHIV